MYRRSTSRLCIDGLLDVDLKTQNKTDITDVMMLANSPIKALHMPQTLTESFDPEIRWSIWRGRKHVDLLKRRLACQAMAGCFGFL